MYSSCMRRIQLTCAVKMDSPYVVGDIDDKLTVPDYVADFVVRMGNAKYADGEPVLPPPRAQQEKQEEETGKLKRLDEEGSQPAEEVKRPYGNAPKSAWVQYAVHGKHGLPPITEERAEGMTKADLISRYDERL